MPVRTHDDGKSGEIDDVAQMMRNVDRSASLICSRDSEFPVGVLARHSNDIPGYRDCIESRRAIALELIVRLMTVQVRIEGKARKWRLRWASICLPAPKTTTDWGLGSLTRYVERREPFSALGKTAQVVIYQIYAYRRRFGEL